MANIETEHGWVNLDTFNRLKDGRIDWVGSAGRKFTFEYDGIQCTATLDTVVDEFNLIISVEGYRDNFPTQRGKVKKGQFSGVFMTPRVKEFRYSAGDIVNGYEVQNAYYKNERKCRRKFYHVQCPVDHYQCEIAETVLFRGQGCPVCSGRHAIDGVNDISSGRPDLIQYFLNKEDAKGTPVYYNGKKDFRCPHCGYVVSKIVSDVSANGFKCPVCSDGISYPNKFVASVLRQLSDRCTIYREQRFSWSKAISVPWRDKPKTMIYDIYIPEINTIIECHGEQHYRENPSFRTSLEYQKENDKIKEQLAKDNGMNYVVLDCSRSTMEHIKQSIMESELPGLLDFNEDDIAWLDADRIASGSKVVDACNLYNNDLGIDDIADELMIHRDTAKKYIKKGRELGLIAS